MSMPAPRRAVPVCLTLSGSRSAFQCCIERLQAREEKPFAPLRQLVGPYILRRLKTDRAIASDLPEKTETAGCRH